MVVLKSFSLKVKETIKKIEQDGWFMVRMGGEKVFKYPIIIERATGNYSAYSPNLPGCVATGSTIKETFSHMRSAIEFHIKGLESEWISIPEPSTKIKNIEISV